MPTYKYLARDERGTAVSGTVEADDPVALADQLKRQGYLVTRSQQLSGRQQSWTFPKWRRIRFDELVLFEVQLAKMVQVGIPLVTALQTLRDQTQNPAFQRVIASVAREVESGGTFSEALARHPRLFSPLFLGMIRAGEVSGRLDDILRRLAILAKRQAALRQQLTTALTYPCLLAIVGAGVMAFLFLAIIPKFLAIFQEAHVPLPLPTRMLQVIGQVIQRGWLVLSMGLVAAAAGLGSWIRTPAGRRRWDRLILRVPLLGELIRQASIAQLCRTLETLFSSGVPVLEALTIAEQTCGNERISHVCRDAQASVREGGTLAAPLRGSGEFPPMVVQMVAIGESSGTVDHMLAEIANHYDDVLEHGVKRLTTLVEPAFLAGLGGLVAFITASLLLPLFRMVNVIR